MTKLEWVQRLIEQGLQELNQKYGKNSSNPQPYHNAQHAREVMAAVQAIAAKAAQAKKIAAKDIPLLTLAACYHDIEHGLASGNEIASAKLIAQKMQRAVVFSPADIDTVKQLVAATTVSFKDGVIKQSATDDYLTKIIADADLSNLGSPFKEFWDHSLKIWQEQTGRELTTEDKPKFISAQIQFLQNHRYYTPEAKTLLPHKTGNIAHLRAMLGK